ncbi:conjugative transfer protein, partial [Stenotrophomonas maltophilia]
YTGTAWVARVWGTFLGETIPTNDAVTRSIVALYVRARASYDSGVLGLREWELVFVMSCDAVAACMMLRYARINPQNP